MRKLQRIITCAGLIGGFLTIAVGTAALSAPAGASNFHRTARLIDTNRVVGFPEHLAPIANARTRPIAPTITEQPISTTVTAGSPATFTATATGSPTPTVKWRVSTNGITFRTISGATSDTYTFTATTAENGYEYDAVFTNSGGTARTNTVTLTVNSTPQSAPSITEEPSNTTVASGNTASFTAAASGSPTPTVQWDVSTNGTTFSPISGANSTTYSFTASTSENGYEYKAVFTNSVNSATTNAATLTVTAPAQTAPSITQQPSSVTVNSGDTASFTAAASGSPTPTVQWEVSTNGTTFSPISGANSTTYSFTASTSENGYEYEAVFTNSVNSATTNPATLTVSAAAPVQSSNWSGYANPNGTYNAVNGSWTVPTVKCSGSGSSYSAQWIGIDGYSSSTVEQDGSEADCLSGSPSYDAWYELYGDSAVNSGDEVELSPSTNPVSPGDVITASVSVSGTTWSFTLIDTSSTHEGWTYNTTANFSGAAETGAEWVVERPEVCSIFSCSLTNLADFGSVTFTNASATTTGGSAGSISANTNTAIEMVNGSTVLALPSALTASGAGFSNTWEAS